MLRYVCTGKPRAHVGPRHSHMVWRLHYQHTSGQMVLQVSGLFVTQCLSICPLHIQEGRDYHCTLMFATQITSKMFWRLLVPPACHCGCDGNGIILYLNDIVQLFYHNTTVYVVYTPVDRIRPTHWTQNQLLKVIQTEVYMQTHNSNVCVKRSMYVYIHTYS